MPRIRIKYVDPVRNRHGVEYLYFRRGKGKRIPLRGPEGSPEFWADYHDAAQGYVPEVNKRDPRSIEHLINTYYHWPEFRQLRESTQKDRRRLLNKFCREFGSEQYKLLMPKHARAIRDSKQDTPAGANNLIKALKQVYKGAVERDLVESNPFDNLRKLKEKKQGAKAWTIEDVEKFESVHPIGTPARLALALLLYTGQRRSDVVTMGRQHVKAEWLTVKQVKTGATIEIPVLKDLRAVIDATKCGDLTFLVTSHGRPYTANGFGNAMRAWCDQAGLPDCSAHGLRKAMASRLAEIGCSTSEIMAITGHKSMQELQVYTKSANQRIRANNVRKMLDD